jgi:hypothetical protein
MTFCLEVLMITLNIDDIKLGMILAHPVRNHQGVLLLEAGARVSKKNIRIFKSWGVLEVTVKGIVAKTQDPIEDTELRVKESIEKELKEKFCDVLDDPVMVEIFNAASKQLTRDFQKNEGVNEHF